MGYTNFEIPVVRDGSARRRINDLIEMGGGRFTREGVSPIESRRGAARRGISPLASHTANSSPRSMLRSLVSGQDRGASGSVWGIAAGGRSRLRLGVRMDAEGRILMEDFSRQVEGKMLEPLILQFSLDDASVPLIRRKCFAAVGRYLEDLRAKAPKVGTLLSGLLRNSTIESGRVTS